MMWCVVANTDTGTYLKVVDAATATSRAFNIGWVIVSWHPTEKDAEKGLRYWNRSPLKLQAKLDEKIMY